MLYKDKNAIVTGGASGINRSVVEKLAAGGARVVIGDVNKEGGEAVAAELRAKGQDVTFLLLDLTSVDSVKQFAAAVLAKLGRVDILVNGAGWSKNMPFVDIDEALWTKIMNLNLTGAMWLTKLVLPGMITHQEGRIVFVSSDAGRVGSLGEAVYSAAKAGLIGFCKAIAREGARFSITANVVCPGPTDTPLLADTPEKIRDGLAKAIPLKRVGRPEEVADVITFFCSSQSSYVTGQVVSASGGLTMVG